MEFHLIERGLGHSLRTEAWRHAQITLGTAGVGGGHLKEPRGQEAFEGDSCASHPHCMVVWRRSGWREYTVGSQRESDEAGSSWGLPLEGSCHPWGICVLPSTQWQESIFFDGGHWGGYLAGAAPGILRPMERELTSPVIFQEGTNGVVNPQTSKKRREGLSRSRPIL